MDINIKLNKDFEKALTSLFEEYGEDFEILNGFHESQLNFSDFVNSFVDKNVADVTIDANANVASKDIRSLMNEMQKSHDKLFAFSKIFYEIKKKYGLKTAKEWLKSEINGAFYLHDASTTTYLPYCIVPTECVTVILNGKKMDVCLEDLYNIVKEKEVLDNTNNVKYKAPKNLLVQDIDKTTGNIRYTKVELISKKDTDKDFYFTKLYNGANILTTEDHKLISDEKDIQAKDIVCNSDEFFSEFDDSVFTNSIFEYNGLPLTKDMGYLIGMYLAEGCEQRGQLSIAQSKANSPKTWNRIHDLLESFNIPYKVYKDGNIFRLRNGTENWERKMKTLFKGKYCDQKRLCEDYTHFNDDFLKGLLSGIIDSDGTIAKNKSLMIRMTSRTLINQIRTIGLHFGVYFGSRLPYIQSQEAKIQQKRPMYSANVNMNRNKDFFLSLNSIKIQDEFNDFMFFEQMANKNYVPVMGKLKARDCEKTYKPTSTVYDLSTESHTFVCNNILVHNCYAYDLSRLAKEGLFFLNNYNNQPPKHLTTFLDDVIEFISFMANRSSGAVGVPNVLIWTFYFWKKDCETGFYIKDPDYYLRQCFQKLIYRLNQPFMRVVQTAFVNMSIFDRHYTESLFGGLEFPDGTYMIDYIDEFEEHQKIFMEVVSKIRSENMFTFPVLTYSLLKRNDVTEEEMKEMIETKNFNMFKDNDFARWCSDHNMDWNDSNFFMSNDVTTLSNCCRLLSDTTKLSGFINSVGGTSLSIGSIKVNTINLMRIALETECDKKKYLKLLEKRTLLCCKTLDAVRHIISRNVDKGLLPNYSDGAIDMSKQYCTVGILGLYEVIEAFGFTEIDEFGNTYYTDEGIEFATEIFNVLNNVKDAFTDEYSFNIESVPAERAACILCQKDNLIYGLDEKFIYSNQWIPLSQKCTINEKLRLSAILDEKCSGGAIAHVNLENNFPNSDMAWEMLNKVAMSGTIYFAFNTRINECKNHHGFVGTSTCPVCGEPVADTYQRIVGYLVPTRNYSKDRFREFNTRRWFEYSEMLKE